MKSEKELTEMCRVCKDNANASIEIKLNEILGRDHNVILCENKNKNKKKKKEFKSVKTFQAFGLWLFL